MRWPTPCAPMTPAARGSVVSMRSPRCAAALKDRLPCQCANADCPKKDAVAAPFVIHTIRPGPSTDGGAGAAADAESDTPSESDAADDPADASVASLVHNDGILPPEQVADLVEQATIRPLIHPGDAGPEPRYTPSRNLAEFVRCRDMGCRFPGCRRGGVQHRH